VTHVAHGAPQSATASRGLRVTSLAALLLFGDWLIEKMEHAPAAAHLVEDSRFVADSIAVREEIDGLRRQLRAGVETTETMSARHREICPAVRARCR
jgi:hypothetical protein